MITNIEKLFEFLASLKVTLFVLFGIAIGAIPGTLVDPEKSTYDFYHSWWFSSLLFLLCLNLIACTFYRKQSRVSVLMIHFSIFFILLGGIVGSRFGFRGNLNLHDGEMAAAIQGERSLKKITLPFQVRSDSFRIRYYEGTNRPSDYESDLVVLEGGEVKVRKTIRVNDPLRYQGITFYQANYGQTPKGFVIAINDQTTGKVIGEGHLGLEESLQVKSAGLAVEVLDFTPDYEGFGPAALVMVQKSKEAPMRQIIFQQFPNFEAKARGRFLPILKDVEASYYTGLQVAKDPGVPLVWIGCGMLTFGLGFGFWSPKFRRFDLRVPTKKPEVVLTPEVS